jgi:RNA polymerase sigma-70 factor, ECF subfamily
MPQSSLKECARTTDAIHLASRIDLMNARCSAQAPKNLATVEHLSDEDLMDKFRHASGAPEPGVFLDEIFRRYQTRMTRWCLRFTKNPDEAVDLAQDVFLKAFEHLHTYRGESKVSTWLYAIARNHCLAFLRRHRITSINITESIEVGLGDSKAMNAFSTVEDEQMFRLLRRAMSTALNPLEAQVITLHYVEGLPLQTITKMLDLANPSGAKAYVLKARRKLTWALRTRRSRRVNRASPRRQAHARAAAA